jgi:hypothetical protein
LRKSSKLCSDLAATLAADIADAWEAIKKDGAYVEGKRTTSTLGV